MKHFLEELCIAALAWIPTAAGMGARLLLWRPLFKRCGRARFGTGIAMQGCKNMSLADGVRIGRGCQLYAEGGTLDMGEDAALSPGVTVDASGGLIRIGKQVAIGPGSVVPVIGASGAISAVFAAYALLFARTGEDPATFLGLHISGETVRALRYAALWVGLQLLTAVAFNTPGQSGIAIWAHIGGFLAGLLLAPLLKRPA